MLRDGCLHPREAVLGHVPDPRQEHQDRGQDEVHAEVRRDQVQAAPPDVREPRLSGGGRDGRLLRRRLLARLPVRGAAAPPQAVLAGQDRGQHEAGQARLAEAEAGGLLGGPALGARH